MLTTLVLLLTILPFMAQKIESNSPVTKKFNHILPESMEYSLKLTLPYEESNTIGSLVKRSTLVPGEDIIIASTIQEYHVMQTEKYDEAYIKSGHHYGMAKPIAYNKFQMQKEDDNKQVSQTKNNQEIHIKRDKPIKESLKFDHPAVESKFYAGFEKVLNSHTQVRKDYNLIMNNTNKDMQLLNLKAKEFLKQNFTPVENFKEYINDEVDSNEVVEDKAKEKLSIQEKEITELHRPIEVSRDDDIGMQTDKNNTKLLETKSTPTLTTETNQSESIPRFLTIQGNQFKQGQTKKSKKSKNRTATTPNFTRIHTTEHQKLHLPPDIVIWPGWTEIPTTVFSTKHPIMNDSLSILYPEELHLPLDVLRPIGQRINFTEEPIKDRRVITTLKYSSIRVEPKIVQGNIARSKDFPFLVSLKRAVQKVSKASNTKLWKNYCGGSIINYYKVLTAAHCFEMNHFDYYHHPDKLRVVAGSLSNKVIHPGHTSNTKQQQWRQIEHVVLHHDFNFPMNDIALVFVDEPFEFDQTMNVNHIAHAKYNTDYAGNCYAAGFGQTNTAKKEDGSLGLMFAKIDVMSRRQCSAVWEMEMNSFLCSRSVVSGVSSGDSGGPLTCSNTLDSAAKSSGGRLLVGIVSGRNYDKTTLYTRVSQYSNWIESNGSYMQEARIEIVVFTMIKIVFTWFVEFLCMAITL